MKKLERYFKNKFKGYKIKIEKVEKTESNNEQIYFIHKYVKYYVYKKEGLFKKKLVFTDIYRYMIIMNTLNNTIKITFYLPKEVINNVF